MGILGGKKALANFSHAVAEFSQRQRCDLTAYVGPF
jgi:hypothetical protein